LLNNPQSLGDTLFVIAFDESGASLKNQIYTAIIGKNVIPGTEDNGNLNHYSLLKLIENEFGLKDLGRNDSAANSINI
jgi:acid phosphatase